MSARSAGAPPPGRGGRFSPRRWRHKWQIKLAALALAILLWAIVRAEQTTDQSLRVAVQPLILDPDFHAAGRPEPATVRVRFAGKWRELGELAINKPVIVLPVRNVGAQRRFIVEPSMVQLPSGFRGTVQAVDVRPRVVMLHLERAVRRAPRRAGVLPALDPPRLPGAPRTSVALPTDSAADGVAAPDTFPATVPGP